jgi:hypothetical protein
MLASPEELHFVFELAVELPRSGEQRRTQHAPGDRSTDEDQGNSHEPTNRHGVLLCAV